MKNPEIQNLTSWLDLTSQQADIISILQDLQEKGLPTSPISIEKEYLSKNKSFIQKSNLFAQLKILLEKNLILKQAGAMYQLNLEGIKSALLAKKNSISQELQEIDNVSSDMNYFLEKVVRPSSVSITYISEPEIYSKLSFYLKNAVSFYLGCDLPPYGLSLTSCRNSQEAVYLETLNLKLHEPNFSFFCLSPLKTETFLKKLSQKYTNKDLIKEEFNALRNRLLEKIKYKNIDLRKTSAPFDFALIEEKNGSNYLFMFLKDSYGLINGGIFINSYETSKHVKQHFLSLLTSSSPFTKESDFPAFIEEPIAVLPRKNRLIAFDVNKVFTQEHTTIELARLLGKEKEAKELITKQIEGEMAVSKVIDESAKLLKGLKLSEIDRNIVNIPLIKNTRAGIKKLQEEGYHILAISTGFSQVIIPLCKSLGIDNIYSNVLEEKEGKLTGRIAEKKVAIDNVKFYIVKYLLEKYSIPEEDSIGVGDGYSDLDLLKAVKKRIAFNPSKKMIKLFKNNDPGITHLVKEPDFKKLVEVILKK